MFVTYIVVTIFAAAANIFSATLDFIRYKPILINMAKVGVSESWLTTLGILKTAGALGLLIGIGVSAVGIAAAASLVLFFIGAIITHLRGHDYSFSLAIVFFLLAAGALGGASGFKLKKAISRLGVVVCRSRQEHRVEVSGVSHAV